ncbi:hypothetical protein ACI8OU_003955 [Escherichia coli]|nr:hypothetical protein [Escherichia coli]EEY7649420.1 hypothetical protein [Escherichia coli]EFB4397911.1 hypothetical protein [Escherichia coli]EFE0723073.1 hypothetical protein [Escherichia coli]EFE0728621.1 hypothetical protein [Escherichia coli]
MKSIYIVTDNQFFSLGLRYIINNRVVYVISPEDIIERGGLNASDVICLIYIKNKSLFRDFCKLIQHSSCELIFFIDLKVGATTNRFISPRLWNARLSTDEIAKRIRSLSTYTRQSILMKCSDLKKRHIFMAAKGISYYKAWVSRRASNHKTAHNHYRSLIQAIGIENVSIHNFCLSENISLAYVTVYNIQNKD